MAADSTSEISLPIECRVGSWFMRRMVILLALVVGLGLFFLYDGAIGYPKKNFNAALFAAFEKGKGGSTDLPKAEDFLMKKFSEDQVGALRDAVDAGKGGETWTSFAATKHLAAEEPKKFTAEEIQQQFHFAIFMGVAGLGILIFTFREKRRKLVCDEDGVVLPNGKRIVFEKIKGLDLAKWDRGIAFLTGEKEAILGKIDDYKFDGAGEIVKFLKGRV